MNGEKLRMGRWEWGELCAILCLITAVVIVLVWFSSRSSAGDGNGDHEAVTARLVTPAPGTASLAATPFGTGRCGVERWPVKTLADAGATGVNLVPVVATIAQLRALMAPHDLRPYQASRLPEERTTYTVTGEAIEWKLEADSDIHLVIADAEHKTLIVEFPDAGACVLHSSPVRAQIATARAAALAAFGTPAASGFQRLSGQVTVTGVFFFDFVHGQAGVAPNGAELHPVISFVKQ